MSFIKLDNDAASLYNGDCIEAMEKLEAGSVDMILCDLPYGTTSLKWDSIIPFDVLWKSYWRVLKPNGAVVLFATTPFTEALGASQIQYLKYKFTWMKPGVTGVLNASKMPLKNTEDILVFYRSLPTYNPQNLQPFGKKVKNSKSRLNENFAEESAIISGGFNKAEYEQKHTGHPRSVLFSESYSEKNIKNFEQEAYNDICVGENGSLIMSSVERKKEGNLHPTQKPIDLLLYLIKTYTNEGETVLDNTMGSGSTGVAALLSGRKFVGIEKDPKYFEICVNRINGATEVKK